jgi:hypothetical protein
MEEIKVLVDMMRELPALALWVIAGFFVYKVICIGSIYGVIKLAIVKFHDFLTTPRTKLHDLGSGLIIRDALPELVGQLSRLKNKGIDSGSNYVHSSDIRWLQAAIDEKEQRDRGER